MHEDSQHEASSFITLTYDDNHLPQYGSLEPHDLKTFWRRLRRATPGSIRYFACGEYGEQLSRPHYHACVFGWDFPDKYHWRTKNGNHIFRSETLEKLWPAGNSEIGTVTAQSAAYVAAYVTKKITGARAESHYQRLSLETGELYEVLPEFVRMSLKPAIGKSWFEEFGDETYRHDSVVINGKEQKPPRAYDKWLEEIDDELLQHIKRQRVVKAKQRGDNSPDRLRVKEEVKRAALATRSNNSRSLEK